MFINVPNVTVLNVSCIQRTLTPQIWRLYTDGLLVWRSGNGVGHVNKVKLRRALLVLRLVTTIPVFSRPLRRTQPGHPSLGGCNEYGCWFWPPLVKKRQNGEFCVAVCPVTMTAGMLTNCMLAELGLSITGLKSIGMSFLAMDLRLCAFFPCLMKGEKNHVIFCSPSIACFVSEVVRWRRLR